MIIKNNSGTELKNQFAYPGEDFTFRTSNGIKFFVSNTGHVFEALRKITNFAPKTIVSWEGKERYKSDDRWGEEHIIVE